MVSDTPSLLSLSHRLLSFEQRDTIHSAATREVDVVLSSQERAFHPPDH